MALDDDPPPSGLRIGTRVPLGDTTTGGANGSTFATSLETMRSRGKGRAVRNRKGKFT